MTGVHEWMCDVLTSRGALVEPTEDGRIRALLPPELANGLGASEWLSLDFRPAPGADDSTEWLERMERALPARPLVTGARLRDRGPGPGVDAETALSAELAIQNGIYKLVEDSAAAATYLFFTFQYAVESDDRSLGLVTVCLNSDARSMVLLPENFLRGIRDRLDEDASVARPDVLGLFHEAASKAAQVAIRDHVKAVEANANRRLARDVERVESYYSGLLAQIEKRAAKRASDPAAAEKERGRAGATQADRLAKLEDLRRKYSLRVRLEVAEVLAVRAPVRRISVRLIRKSRERTHALDWNPVLHTLESPLCESCSARAHPMYLCDEVHMLCVECWTRCPACSRFFCRACQARCKCGGGGCR